MNAWRIINLLAAGPVVALGLIVAASVLLVMRRGRNKKTRTLVETKGAASPRSPPFPVRSS